MDQIDAKKHKCKAAHLILSDEFIAAVLDAETHRWQISLRKMIENNGTGETVPFGILREALLAGLDQTDVDHVRTEQSQLSQQIEDVEADGIQVSKRNGTSQWQAAIFHPGGIAPGNRFDDIDDAIHDAYVTASRQIERQNIEIDLVDGTFKHVEASHEAT